MRLCQGAADKEGGMLASNVKPQSIEDAVDKTRWHQHNHQAIYGWSSRKEVKGVSLDTEEGGITITWSVPLPSRKSLGFPSRGKVNMVNAVNQGGSEDITPPHTDTLLEEISQQRDTGQGKRMLQEKVSVGESFILNPFQTAGHMPEGIDMISKIALGQDSRDVEGGWKLGRKSGAGQGRRSSDEWRTVTAMGPWHCFLTTQSAVDHSASMPLLENNALCGILDNPQREGKGVIQEEGFEGILPAQPVQFEYDFQL
ncbi:unnamed protein product [Mytilus coruscus]|uniref:Uncharacterized protein n=1 Tax=Mytilus coruscus TaxID=42192 RepID=A0A6J8DMP1_MYTCO|nr:unnamed protein product [Mytilus coruscus]